jgi:hypothetical protein
MRAFSEGDICLVLYNLRIFFVLYAEYTIVL